MPQAPLERLKIDERDRMIDVHRESLRGGGRVSGAGGQA
jgi:hypothetical protein